MIGVFTHNKIRNMQLDTIRISEQTLGDFASAIHMTISIGAATHVSGFPGGIINTGDQALCRAKHSGRNKVAVSGPEIEVTES